MRLLHTIRQQINVLSQQWLDWKCKEIKVDLFSTLWISELCRCPDIEIFINRDYNSFELEFYYSGIFIGRISLSKMTKGYSIDSFSTINLLNKDYIDGNSLYEEYKDVYLLSKKCLLGDGFNDSILKEISLEIKWIWTYMFYFVLELLHINHISCVSIMIEPKARGFYEKIMYRFKQLWFIRKFSFERIEYGDFCWLDDCECFIEL